MAFFFFEQRSALLVRLGSIIPFSARASSLTDPLGPMPEFLKVAKAVTAFLLSKPLRSAVLLMHSKY